MANLTERARTRIQLCGSFGVEIEGLEIETALRGRQARLLFAYLVLNRTRPVRRDELVGALWPERPPASPEDALNTLLSRLRKGLGEGVICGRSELTLVLGPDAVVDIETASLEIQRAEGALEQSDWQRAQSSADLALGIAERGFLPEVEAAWVEHERRRLEELRLRALECLAACGLGLGGSRLSQTERAARTLIAAAPYRETGYRYLMQALAERGRVAEALKVFDDIRQLLRAELGTPPGAGLRSLHERLLSRQDSAPQTEGGDPLAAGSTMMTVLFSNLSAPDDDSGRADGLRRAHARLLRDAAATQGGQRVTEMGDGLLAVFAGARNGLGCAVQMQQAAERHNRRHPDRQLSVRAALHSGEPVRAGDEHSSGSVGVAKRLCERAEPGQVLASEPVRSLAPEEQRFREIESEQTGRAESPGRLEVLWEPTGRHPHALPPAFSAGERDLLAGRESDLERLWGFYEQARSGARQIVLLRGEPGIGKTRLATEVALRAHAAGAVVLHGRCDEEPLLPHQPFVEALRHHVGACPLPELVGQVGRNGGELRRIVPELADRLPDLAQPLAGDPEGERHRLFEAVSTLLYEAAAMTPVVLVLDDLHWADKPTLLLLRHLARYPREAPLLVLGTYRETELDPGHPLSGILADLSREHGFERHPLDALDLAAVARLVTSYAGREEPELNRMIFNETAGNPFFVVEMLRHLTELRIVPGGQGSPSDLKPGEAGIPESVKDVIGRRIARLGPAAHHVLSTASVAGRDFQLAVLEHVSDLAEDELVEALDKAVRARVIEEPAGGGGHYTFSHALIRETLYGDLTATRRALLHRRVAVALEDAHGEDLDPYRAELAHHLARAGSAGDLDRAVAYGARAGEFAMAQLAYEQAATHYRQAVSLIGSAERPRQVQRCDLVIAQGEAERRAGDPAYRETLLEGARLAQELGEADRLARAALANNRGFFSATTGVDRDRVSVLEVALEAHAVGDTATRARLLAHLAVELVPDPDWPRRAKLSDESLAMARRLGEPRTLLRTLNYRYGALWGPRTLPERLADSRDATRIADQLGDPLLAFNAAHFGAHAQMEAGDLPLADRLLERAGELTGQLGQPIIDWYFAIARAKRASISCPPGEAEELAYAARDIGRSASQPDHFAWFANQLWVARFLQGSFERGRPNLLKGAELGTEFPARDEYTGSRSVPMLVEAANSVILCEVGRTEDARPRFDELMRDELSDLPHDWAALAIPAMAGVACAQLGDARRAETLYALLEPHEGQFVDTGTSWFGATTHHLALLAATLERPDEADARFADAVRVYDSLGARAWLARARLDWARDRVARGGGQNRRHAEGLLDQVLEAARELALAGIELKAATLLGELRSR